MGIKVLATKLSRRDFLGMVLGTAAGIATATIGVKALPVSTSPSVNLSDLPEPYELHEMVGYRSIPLGVGCTGPMFNLGSYDGCRDERGKCCGSEADCIYDERGRLYGGCVTCT